MLYQIFSLLLNVAAGLLGGACLLRLYMQYQRVPFGNPLGQFVFALTDWLVLPLRRLLPAVGRLDTASLVGLYLVEVAKIALLALVGGRMGLLALLPVVAAFDTLRLALSTAMGLMIIYAIVSWVRSDSPLVDVIDRICTPLLRPLRRVIPLVGGIDLSPLAFLVLVQIASIVLDQVEQLVLR